MHARMILLTLLLAGCSAPAIEVIDAHGLGSLTAMVAGERLEVRLEAETVEAAGGPAVCPHYSVSFGGAEVSGVAPGAGAVCDGVAEERAIDWTELLWPVVRIGIRLCGLLGL